MSLKGLDITVDQRISNIDEFKAAELYEYLFKFLLIIILILVIPLIYSLGRKFLYYLRLSKDNSGSYVLIIFSLFSFFILFGLLMLGEIFILGFTEPNWVMWQGLQILKVVF